MRLAQEIQKDVVKDVVEDCVGLDGEGNTGQWTEVPEPSARINAEVWLLMTPKRAGCMSGGGSLRLEDTYNLIQSIAVIIGRHNDARLARGSCHGEDDGASQLFVRRCSIENRGVGTLRRACSSSLGMRRPRVGWLSGDGLIVPSDPVSGNYIRGGWRPNGPDAGKVN